MISINKAKERLLIIIIIVAVSLLSSWTWVIFRNNLPFWILAMILTYLLLEFFVYGQKNLLKKIVISLLIFLILGFSLINSFDSKIFKTQELEKIQIKDRYQYFFKELGYFYADNRYFVYNVNKISPFMSKYLNNQAYVFDIETYFPSKFPLFLFPLAITGIYYFLNPANKLMILVFTVVTLSSGFIDTKNVRGLIIFYPIMTFFICLGFIRIWRLLR